MQNLEPRMIKPCDEIVKIALAIIKLVSFTP